MTPMEEVRAALRGTGLWLQKAVPKGPDHLSLELRDPDGAVLAGQWNRSIDRTAQRWRATRRTCPDPDAVQQVGPRVLVQAHGADRRLTDLPRVATRNGAALVAHRVERRAVVRCGDGHYTKVVRPSRYDAALVTTEVPHTPHVRVPTLVSADPETSSLTTAALPGRSLTAVLADASASPDDVREAGYAVGRAVADLHRNPPPARRRHLAGDEVDTTRAWLRVAEQYGVLPQAPELLRRLATVGRELDATTPARAGLVHGDLHDGQLFLASGEPVGVLDFDLAAAGSPALDLGNLLAHLQLRVWQGQSPAERAGLCADALLDGYGPAPAVTEQIPYYRLTTWLRLAAVYAFRPGGDVVARRLAESPEINALCTVPEMKEFR